MIRVVDPDDLIADIEAQVAYNWGKWRYVTPPKLVFLPRDGQGFFLRPDSNRWEFLPKSSP